MADVCLKCFRLVKDLEIMTGDMLYPAGCLLTALAGVMAVLSGRRNPLVVLAGLGIPGLVLTALGAIRVLAGTPLRTEFLKLAHPFGPVCLSLDSLSALFVLLFSVVGLPVLLEAVSYGRHEEQSAGIRHACGLSSLLVALLLLPAVENIYLFLAVWELMTLASFMLVMHESGRADARRAAIYYLAMMQAGAFLLFGGFLLLSSQTGSVELSGFSMDWSDADTLVQLGWVLLLSGFACKAGLVPLHSWLPIAHPAAPAHISALMSAAMIKAGIYGIIRVLSWITAAPALLAAGLLIWGMITAVHGAALALTRQDLKELLAASTVENSGLIVLGLALGEAGEAAGLPSLAFLARAAALLHLLHHGLFKSLLFLAAGAVVHATGTRQLDELGGLQVQMPRAASGFFVAGLSAGALPPGNGFYSELLLVVALFHAASLTILPGWPVLICLALVSLGAAGVLAMNAWLKAYGVVFLGSARQQRCGNDAHGFSVVAGAIPFFLIIITALIPHKTLALCLGPLQVMGETLPMETVIQTENLLIVSSRLALASLVTGLFFYLVRCRLLTGRTIRRGRTWDCGYPAGTSRMQYTASSFVRSFLVYLRPILWTRMKEDTPTTFFPATGHFSSETVDPLEPLLISPWRSLIRRGSGFLGRLRVVSIQTVILQMVIFLGILLLLMRAGGYGG